MLCRAQGVGPKLAARLVTELKDKVARIVVSPFLDGRRSAPRRLAAGPRRMPFPPWSISAIGAWRPHAAVLRRLSLGRRAPPPRI